MTREVAKNKENITTHNIETVKRTGAYTTKEYNQQFVLQDSFVDKLPWVEFLDDKKIMLLEDSKSIGAIFELTTVGTEGRTATYLEEIRDQVTNALQDSFLEKDTNPYVVQFYCQDDDDGGDYAKHLEHYINERVEPNEFSEEWLRIMKKHFKDIAKPSGLFEDKNVTGSIWRGQVRKTRMVIYRYVAGSGKQSEDFNTTIEEMETTIENVINALFSAGVLVKQLNGEQIHSWLVRWFNPNPDIFDDADEFYKTLSYVPQKAKDNELPLLFNDFSENLFVKGVRSDKGRWYFDEKPHSIVMVDSLRRSPKAGQITGEMPRGNNINALFDLMPKDTKMVLTIVVYPQDKFENHLTQVYNSAIGENTESVYTKEDCVKVGEYLKDGHKLYLSSLGFFLRGDDDRDLTSKERRVRTILQSAGLVCVQENCEVAPLSTYLRWLPMNFNPNDDTKRLYTKFNFVQHITNLLPIFGRSQGTGNPGMTYFNRGGASLDFDPLNKNDRAKAAHMLLLGPTGAGKSATLNAKIAQLMATYRPRLFIIEAGNSFGLISEYAKRYGLTVNRVQLKPGSGATLPMFRDADKINFDDEVHIPTVNADEKINDDIDEDLEDDQRDILGEMEMIARLMITGGKISEDERMTRADEAVIRKAIVMSAKKCKEMGKITLTEDIRDAFFEISNDENLPKSRRLRAYEMGESIGLFCQKGSFDAELFNSAGEIWEDADITLVDLATLAREGYEVQLAIAYISLINHINSLGEKHQFSGRPIVNITDEAHIITVNPMLAKFLAKAGKMWRKLGIWLWLATQNLADFPDTAKKLLSMMEWWELLCLDKAEAEEVARFKDLNEEQKNLVLSARKENRKYTEGVVLSTKNEMLFRVVPPSIYLAMAMTEPEEKAERAMLMREHNISELDAALMVAKNIDKARGIVC